MPSPPSGSASLGTRLRRHRARAGGAGSSKMRREHIEGRCPRARFSASGGKEPNLRAALDGAPGGSGQPSKLFESCTDPVSEWRWVAAWFVAFVGHEPRHLGPLRDTWRRRTGPRPTRRPGSGSGACDQPDRLPRLSGRRPSSSGVVPGISRPSDEWLHGPKTVGGHYVTADSFRSLRYNPGAANDRA
jgi:hypothetical protein